MTNKSNVDALDDYDESWEEDLPIEYFSKDEAKEVLNVMSNQEEMFMGGLNDPLMSTPIGYYKELRDEFAKVHEAWNKFKKYIITQADID